MSTALRFERSTVSAGVAGQSANVTLGIVGRSRPVCGDVRALLDATPLNVGCAGRG